MTQDPATPGALPSPEPRPRSADRRSAERWLAALGLGLTMLLVSVVWLQVRQMSMLDSRVRYEGDNLVWSFYQVESEYLQLRDALRLARMQPEQDRSAAVRLRFELFASRLALVQPDRTRGIARLGDAHERTLNQLQAFLQRHDPLLADTVSGPLTPAQIDRVLADLDALPEPIHDLALAANQVVADLVSGRNDAVREQNRLGIGLTLFQLLLVLVFAAVTFRQFRALGERRRELEALTERLQHTRLEALAASQAKSVFLANMSHELRTPFNGLLGMLALLEGTRLDSEQTEHLRTVRSSASHLLGLLNDILDFSKLESGQLDLLPEPTLLPRMLKEVVAITAPTAEAKGLQLSLNTAADLPIWVLADGRRLKQILFNLCANAVKFTEQGSVQLQVTRSARQEGQPAEAQLRFAVRDSGIGMAPELQSRLFQRFSQGDSSTSRRYGGTGLGLEISRSLAQRMGGDIEVASAPGQGSVFTLVVALPVVAPPIGASPDAPAVAQASHAGGAGNSDPTPPDAPDTADTAAPAPAGGAARLDLLVVDDHPVNRRYMALLLQRLGHGVRLASDGIEAVTQVQAQVPDLVFMDLHMPGQDGFAATRTLRALPGPAGQVPIVALSADVFDETRRQVREVGMDNFLAKPVQPDDIIALLAQHAAPPAAPAPPPPVEAPALRAAQPGPARMTPPPVAPPAARRRFRSSDVTEQLDMAVIGDVCLGVSLEGLRQVLGGFIADSSGNQAALLQALASGQTERLAELAHGIKGAAASVGLRAVMEATREIEANGAGYTLAECQAAGERLVQRLADAHALLQRMGFV